MEDDATVVDEPTPQNIVEQVQAHHAWRADARGHMPRALFQARARSSNHGTGDHGGHRPGRPTISQEPVRNRTEDSIVDVRSSVVRRKP